MKALNYAMWDHIKSLTKTLKSDLEYKNVYGIPAGAKMPAESDRPVGMQSITWEFCKQFWQLGQEALRVYEKSPNRFISETTQIRYEAWCKGYDTGSIAMMNAAEKMIPSREEAASVSSTLPAGNVTGVTPAYSFGLPPVSVVAAADAHVDTTPIEDGESLILFTTPASYQRFIEAQVRRQVQMVSAHVGDFDC